jgi:uncharacterized surface protein with fasciclin (FAS1) repeats
MLPSDLPSFVPTATVSSDPPSTAPFPLLPVSPAAPLPTIVTDAPTIPPTSVPVTLRPSVAPSGVPLPSTIVPTSALIVVTDAPSDAVPTVIPTSGAPTPQLPISTSAPPTEPFEPTKAPNKTPVSRPVAPPPTEPVEPTAAPDNVPVSPPAVAPLVPPVGIGSTTAPASICDAFDFDGPTDGAGCTPNILDTAREDPDLSLAVILFERAGLMELFDCPGPFTVQFPTNDALENIDESILVFLLENQEELTNLMLYHVLPGSFPTSELEPGPTPTLAQGAEVVISLNPTKFNNSTVIMADISACNGLINTIDTILTLLPTSKFDAC